MSTTNILNSPVISWMDGRGPESDIVISSRVRLARNLRGVPFPNLLDEHRGRQVVEGVRSAVAKVEHKLCADLEWEPVGSLTPMERQIFMEKHLISPELAASDHKYRGVMVNGEGSVAIMVNEEDHIRLQTFLPGLQLNQALKYAQVIDEQMEKSLDYAFDERRGYLTACPTNVGTGMRASVMLHLPAITMVNQAPAIIGNLGQFGLTARGVYGEGSQQQGNIFQISNQVTLGQSEDDIVNNLWTITMQIIEQERQIRNHLLKDMKHQIEDKIMRSYGILTHAHLLSSQEALELLSDVRLGVGLGIITGIDQRTLNELMVNTSPAHLQRAAGREMEPQERDITRAETVRKRLGEMKRR